MEAEKPGLVMGKVYLIPTTLGDNAPLEVLPISVKGTIERIDHYIVENEKTARRFIKRVSPSKSQPDLQLYSLNKYTNPEEIPSFLDPCIHGFDVGIISEAGCPGIAELCLLPCGASPSSWRTTFPPRWGGSPGLQPS